jgi:Uma2 family endonuclease
MGVRLVWYVDPKARTVRVYTSTRRAKLVGSNQILDGGAVLPGFSVSLREIFARAEGEWHP